MIGRNFAVRRATGFRPPTHVPINWSATEHVVWKQAIPGNGWSSPVLSQGKLYLTTAEEVSAEVTSLRALCVDAADGHIVWNVELFQPEADAVKEHHSKNGVASPSPIVTSDRLYVHFGHLGTAALDLNGNILWRQSKVSYKPRHGNGGSPVLVGNSLIFSCDASEDPFVVALDSDNGEVRWKTPRNTTAAKTFSFCTPTVIELDGVDASYQPRQWLCRRLQSAGWQRDLASGVRRRIFRRAATGVCQWAIVRRFGLRSADAARDRSQGSDWAMPRTST